MEKRDIKNLPPDLKLRQFNSRKETVIGEDLVNNIFYKIQVVKYVQEHRIEKLLAVELL